MLWTIIFIFTVLILLLGYFLKNLENKSRQKIKNIKTGEFIPTLSIFTTFIYILKREKSLFLIDYIYEKVKNFDIYCVFYGHILTYNINDHKIANIWFSDTETFQKASETFTNPILKRLQGQPNVAKQNGEDWKRHRKSINPGFYKIADYTGVFTEKSNMVLNAMETGDTFIVNDVSNFMQKMTLDVLGKAIFGHEFNSIKGTFQEDLLAYNFLMKEGLSIKTIFFGSCLAKFPNSNFMKKFDSSMKNFDNLYENLVEKAKKKLDSKDLSNRSMLELMVEASLIENEDSKLSSEELKANVWLFFVAGHETTSTALSYAINYLAQFPEYQEKLRREIYQVLGDEKSFTYEKINQLDFLHCFIKETKRKSPPLILISPRKVTKDVILGDWSIPQGVNIGINVYAIHHSKDVYGDPENFRPERWTSEEQSKRKIPNSAWIPFSSGPRVCIGNNFSMFEQKVFLVELLKRFKLTRLSSLPIKPTKSFGMAGPIPADIKFEKVK